MTIPGLGTPSSQRDALIIAATAVEWGLTIPPNSPNRDAAIAFVSAVLGPSGRAALASNGPAPITPARVSRADSGRVPAALKSLVVVAR